MNLQKINHTEINPLQLNLVRLQGGNYASKSVAWKGYCQDGLCLCLDCQCNGKLQIPDNVLWLAGGTDTLNLQGGDYIGLDNE